MYRRETVVLVHGLYMHGLYMNVLARRLRRAGYHTVAFSYPSLRRTPADNARALLRVVESLDAPLVHFLAHSLGGLVVRHLFDLCPSPPAGRVVTLGTPHQGSLRARALCARGCRFLLGRSIVRGLLGDLPPWQAQRQLGSVAGTWNLGLGRLVASAGGAGDGVVTVAETQLPGMVDHICLPVNHVGMLFAPSVAAQACAFLAAGRFRRGRPGLGSSASRW